MAALVSNNASTTIAGTVGQPAITSTQLTIPLTTNTGALFPSPSGNNFFYATLVNASNVIEVVKCTSRAGDTLTVVRGQDGTTAAAWNGGDRCELRPTAGLFNNKLDLDTGGTIGSNTIAGAIGISGPVVTTRALTFNTAGTTSTLPRWEVQCNNNNETGSNAGSGFSIVRFSDAGTQLDTPLGIARQTGAVTIADALTVNGAMTAGSGMTVDGAATITGGLTVSAGTVSLPAGSIPFSAVGTPSAGSIAFSALGTPNNGVIPFAALGTPSAGSIAFSALGTPNNGAIPFAALGTPTHFSENGQGYTTLPGGIILQWGHYTTGGNNWGGTAVTITFPLTFPSGCFNVQCVTDNQGNVASPHYAMQLVAVPSSSTFQASATGYNSGGGQDIAGFYWLAIGW